MIGRRHRLLVITLLTEFSALLVIFVASRMLADHQVSLFWMGLVGGGFGLSSSMSSVYCGALSDRIGRRRSVILGLVLALVGVCLAWAGMQGVLLIGMSYVILGVSLGSVYPALSAWLLEGHGNGASTRDLLRTLMGFSIAWNLGLIGAQITGGWLYAHVAPQAPLALAIVLLLLSIAIAMIPMPQAGQPAGVAPDHEEKITDRQRASSAFSRLSWIANIGGTFAMAMILHLFPALMVDMGVEADRQGMLLAYSRLIVVGTYLLLFLTRFWHYRVSTALLAQAFGVVGLMALSVAKGLPTLALGLTGLAVLVGYNYFASLYYSSTRGSDKARGAAMGLHEATLTAGMMCGSVLGGMFGAFSGVRSPYLLGAAVILVLSITQACMWLRYRRRVGQPGLDLLSDFRARA